MPLKTRACERNSEGSPAEVFLPGHNLCRSDSSSENSTLAATFKLEEIQHSNCTAPVVLGGVEIVYTEGRILNLVQ